MTSTLSLLRPLPPLSSRQDAEPAPPTTTAPARPPPAPLDQPEHDAQRREAAVVADVVDVGALFTEHAPFLLRVVERLTGYGAHVEDIVQDVFVVAHRRRRELRAGPELRGWLYRVASRRAQRHRRSLFRFFRLRDAVRDEPAAGPARPDDVAVAHDARAAAARRIRKHVMALPFALREVFVLHELESLPTRTVAELLGIPEGTVWSRLSAARKQFRALWTHADVALAQQEGRSR